MNFALFGFHFDLWTIVGFLGQFIFFMRFVIQWYETEKRGYSYFPISFWYYSIIGSLIICCYAIKRNDVVFFSGTLISLTIYVRNLVIGNKKEKDS
ncbi:MAG: lipid-A-disaccharide synthase N-terminal domain-containing protein [Bacteriovoracaceae bacterium]